MASRLTLLTLLTALAVPTAALAQDAVDDVTGGADGASDGNAEGGGAEEFEEPAAWEKPPVEEEKPKEQQKVVMESPAFVDPLPFSVGLALGYGFDTDNNNQFSVNPYSLGFGLRGGYSLDFGLHVGLQYTYFIGSSDTLRAGLTNQDVSANYMLLGGTVGYDAWFGDIIIRPELDIGFAIGLTEVQLKGSDTVVSLALAPGMSVIAPMDEFYLGGTGRFHIVTGDGTSGVLLYFVGGYRFNTN